LPINISSSQLVRMASQKMLEGGSAVAKAEPEGQLKAYERLQKATVKCLASSEKPLTKKDKELLLSSAADMPLSALGPLQGVQLRVDLKVRAEDMGPGERLGFAARLAELMPRIESDIHREQVRKAIVGIVYAELERVRLDHQSELEMAEGMALMGEALKNLGEKERGNSLIRRSERAMKEVYPVTQDDVEKFGARRVNVVRSRKSRAESSRYADNVTIELVGTVEGKFWADLIIHPVHAEWYGMLMQLTPLVNGLKRTPHYKIACVEGKTDGKIPEKEKFADWLRHNVYRLHAFRAEGKALWQTMRWQERKAFERLFDIHAMAAKDSEVVEYFTIEGNRLRHGFQPNHDAALWLRFSELPKDKREAILAEFFPRFWARFRMGDFDGSWRNSPEAVQTIGPCGIACLLLVGNDADSASRMLLQARKDRPSSASSEYMEYFMKIMETHGCA